MRDASMFAYITTQHWSCEEIDS